MKHLIISRVNLFMKLDGSKYNETELWKRPGWNEDRLKMLNEWTRPSLRKQTNQNFTFVSLWQAGHVTEGGELDNEIKIEIHNTGTPDDEPLDYGSSSGKKTLNFSDQITAKIKERFNPPLLITNCDCDDCLRYDFVEVLQKEAVKYNDYVILDLKDRHQYNVNTGQTGVKSSREGSPFLSSYEPVIKCISIIYNHSLTPKNIPIVNIPGLCAMNTINDSNMFVRGTGKRANFNIDDYR